MHRLAPPTEKQWVTTSGFHGDWKKDEMKRSLRRTASEHWFEMHAPQDHSRMYKTTSRVDLCVPSEQKPPAAGPHIPEDGGGRRVRNGSLGFTPFVLKDYRQKWSAGDAD